MFYTGKELLLTWSRADMLQGFIYTAKLFLISSLSIICIWEVFLVNHFLFLFIEKHIREIFELGIEHEKIILKFESIGSTFQFKTYCLGSILYQILYFKLSIENEIPIVTKIVESY